MPFPLIRSVLRGIQRGQVFVDRLEEPRWAFVRNAFGFSYVLGEPDGRGAELLVSGLGEHPSLRGRYHIWYSPPDSCRAILDGLMSAGVRVRTRIKYEVSEVEGLQAVGVGRSCGIGEVLRLDAELLRSAECFGLNIGSRFWNSEAEFLKNGMGSVVLVSRELASICYSACLVDQVAEIDVFTAEPFRGGGLALMACRAFLGQCREMAVTPSWDCFDYNLASVRLAAALGFGEVMRYSLYTFNS